MAKDTRDKIIKAAFEAFAELGFHGASTREIAGRVGVTQSVLTYHFNHKDELWQAAMIFFFEQMNDSLELEGLEALVQNETLSREEQREIVRQFVRFCARYPQFLQIIVEEGRAGSERFVWLVENYVKPRYQLFSLLIERFLHIPDVPAVHVFYAILGASAMVFASRRECQRVADVDPMHEAFVEQHAAYLAQVFVP